MSSEEGTISCLKCRNRIALWRGLCNSCYARYYKDIQARQTTWEKLIEEGKALPKRRNKNFGKI